MLPVDRDPVGPDALAFEQCSVRLMRRQAAVGNRVDQDPVVLLGHRPVEAPQAGLEMQQRDRSGVGGNRASNARVGVTLDHDCARAELRQ